MNEVEIGGRRYRTGKLDAFKQFHLFRKLMPILSGLGAMFAASETEESAVDFWSSLGPVANALATMSQEDSEYILKTCMAVCTTWNGQGWSRIASPNGDMMFDDINAMDMLMLSFEVVKDNLGGFFPGPSSTSEQGIASLASIMPR